MKIDRVIIIVLDGVGIGGAPDAAEYGDEGSNTLVHVAEALGGLALPNLQRMGLGNIAPVLCVPPRQDCTGDYGVMQELSKGKDTTTGHWEMAGVITERPFPTYPHGFPPDVIEAFEKEIGRETLGNYPASGTEIIKQLGEEHMRTGKPIVYTSADSVFQIAAHEEVIPLWELYKMCETAREIMEPFEARIGRHTLGNKPASGTEILKELGEEHVRTGKPIVYTSGDSVFQIAAHENVIPVPELYRMCEIARKLLDGKHRVGRVIARPFEGAPGHFTRTSRRHDYAVDPPKPMLMDVLAEKKIAVFGIGKIHDIYNGRGVDDYVTTKSNADGMEELTAAVRERPNGLIFCNLVDFDMLFGHRKDLEGFARSLEEFDAQLAPYLKLLGHKDLLIITADHGCDPDPRWATTDHSREYVPILAYTPAQKTCANLGTRSTLADMGQTISENFSTAIPHGASFLSQLG
jgi:phosphopentomutase